MTAKGNMNTEIRLLQAAVHLFSRRGYSGTTTHAIAAAAGMAEGNLFRYFPHKHDILMRLAAEFARIVMNLLRNDEAANASVSEANAVDRLEKVLYENVLEPGSVLFPYFQVIVTEAQYDSELRAFIERAVLKEIIFHEHPLAEYIKQGTQAGAYGRSSEETAAPKGVIRILASFHFALMRQRELEKADNHRNIT